MDLELTQPPG